MACMIPGMPANRPINPERFFSTAAKRWVMNPLTEIMYLFHGNEDQIINMAGGLPPAWAMPFKSMDVTLKDGTKFCLEGKQLDAASQYGIPTGCSEPLKVFRDLILQLYNPPTSSIPAEQGGLKVQVSAGNTESLTKVMELVLEPGDYILLEEPCYTGILTKATNEGLRMLPIDTDINGLIPASLRQVLSQWTPDDALDPKSDIPKLLVTVPHASNPTGSSICPERRKEIYQICREYDIIILEDDPYYHLMFGKKPFQSFLSMDEDGRVIRLDSFSKIIAPGFRCGLISGNATLLSRLSWKVASSQSHPNNLAQFIYHQIFAKKGIDGFLEDVNRIRIRYKEQCDVMIQAANNHLKGLVEFEVPSGGMFVWMKIVGLQDTREMIKKRAVDKGVLVLPGAIFLIDQRNSPYVRVNYVSASPAEIDQGLRQLALLITEELEHCKETE